MSAASAIDSATVVCPLGRLFGAWLRSGRVITWYLRIWVVTLEPPMTTTAPSARSNLRLTRASATQASSDSATEPTDTQVSPSCRR